MRVDVEGAKLAQVVAYHLIIENISFIVISSVTRMTAGWYR
jgi:hypothetical protein